MAGETKTALLMRFLFFISKKLDVDVDYIGWIKEFLAQDR